MHHIYMGEGKGKTTAAVGLAVRCAGSGESVLFTQFLKPATSGELEALNELDNMQLLICPACGGFTWQMTEEDRQEITLVYERYLWDIQRIVLQGKFRMLILDEIIGACTSGLVEEHALWEILEQMPDELEIVMTGRFPSDRMLEWADYITEMKKIRHPFDKGIKARKGIEY
jgi:cob(I)alamin adenosyltransferase